MRNFYRIVNMRTVSEIKQELLYHSAHMSLKSYLLIAEICTLFDELMQQGIYFDEFLDIACLDHETVVREEFSPILERALRAAGIYIFKDKDKAKNHVVFYHLDRIVNQERDVQEEASTLYHSLGEGCCNFGFFGPAENFCLTYYNYANEYEARWRTAEKEKLINDELFIEAKNALQVYLKSKGAGQV